MSYYDVDAILTDSQKLPCTFELDVPGLGYLEGNAGGTVRSLSPFLSTHKITCGLRADSVQVKAGTKIDLPMWLGIMLSVSTG
jgi:GINS complex subunit 3